MSIVLSALGVIKCSQSNLNAYSVPRSKRDEYIRRTGMGDLSNAAFHFFMGLQCFGTSWAWLVFTVQPWPYNVVATGVAWTAILIHMCRSCNSTAEVHRLCQVACQ